MELGFINNDHFQDVSVNQAMSISASDANDAHKEGIISCVVSKDDTASQDTIIDDISMEITEL